MGLFSLLGVATRGLSMSQTGMDLAGQNISNADVDGYSRKRMTLEPDYVKNGTFGQMGFGVDVVNIQRMRSVFIDVQIRNQNQEVGYYEEKDQTLQGIENIFTEPSDTGIQKYMDQFFDSWQSLSLMPNDLSARTMVKTNGEILTDVFHNLSTQLTGLNQSKNDLIRADAGEVNKLTKEIFNLNREIAAVEITKQNANDSRDKRDKALKDLANLIDIDVNEDSLGQVTVTTAGNIIVSPAYQQDIEITSNIRQLADGTSINNVGLRFADSKRDYFPQSGKIRGLFDSRDIVIPEYQTKLDTLARSFVAKVNTQHELGYTLNGYPGVDFFDATVTGASDITISAAIASDVRNIAAGSGGQIRSYTEPLPFTLTFGNPAAAFTNQNILSGSVRVMAGATALAEGVDYDIDYTNGTIQLLHSGYNGTPLAIDYKYSDGSSKGPGDNANAIAIAQLRENATMTTDVLGNPTATFGEFYSAFIGKLGLSHNEATSNLDSRNYLITQFQTQQDSIAGVSLDDEMADIIKYQHIYAASARVITIASEMLDALIKM
jgi:flagellar hook-associated protein 1